MVCDFQRQNPSASTSLRVNFHVVYFVPNWCFECTASLRTWLGHLKITNGFALSHSKNGLK
eukprot:UN07623